MDPADFIIAAVKYNALPAALDTIKNCIGPDTTIISAMNGISSEHLKAMTDFLDRAKISYAAEDDILHRLWGKFMLNVGVNQTCLAYEATCSGTLAPGEAHDTMVGAMREVIALTKA